MDLTLNRYQDEAAKTATYPGTKTHQGLNYTILGLCGEAGELANHFKKVTRDDNEEVTSERREAMLGELGDVLWYLSQCAAEMGSSLEEVAWSNLGKLQSRLDRNKIQGSGDHR